MATDPAVQRYLDALAKATPQQRQQIDSFIASQGKSKVPVGGFQQPHTSYIPEDPQPAPVGGTLAQSQITGTPAVPAASVPTAAAGPTAAQNASAKATIAAQLAEYGLDSPSLTEWAWGLYVQGYDTSYIFNELRGRQEFKDRFPAIAARQAAGLSPISPAQYVQREAAYDQAVHAAGITGFFDRNALYTQWIGGDVSASEVASRAQNAYQAALGEPLDVRAELQRLYGNDAAGVATAYFLDPHNTLGEATRRLQSGEIGAGSSRAGFGLLTRAEAEQLAGLGVTGAQAQQDFGQLASLQPVLGEMTGQHVDVVGRQDQLDAAFAGNANAQRRINRRQREQQGLFESGGGFASGKTGFAVGTAA